jgi:hypothetical protein
MQYVITRRTALGTLAALLASPLAAGKTLIDEWVLSVNGHGDFDIAKFDDGSIAIAKDGVPWECRRLNEWWTFHGPYDSRIICREVNGEVQIKSFVLRKPHEWTKLGFMAGPLRKLHLRITPREKFPVAFLFCVNRIRQTNNFHRLDRYHTDNPDSPAGGIVHRP